MAQIRRAGARLVAPGGFAPDGAAGPEFTITHGNNVHAYLDQDANNQPDAGADVDGGAGLTFGIAADLSEHAQNYRDAVVTNLFYWNNIFHDVMWRYGFDEASGNFQASNYGRGAGEGDSSTPTTREFAMATSRPGSSFTSTRTGCPIA